MPDCSKTWDEKQSGVHPETSWADIGPSGAPVAPTEVCEEIGSHR